MEDTRQVYQHVVKAFVAVIYESLRTSSAGEPGIETGHTHLQADVHRALKVQAVAPLGLSCDCACKAPPIHLAVGSFVLTGTERDLSA